MVESSYTEVELGYTRGHTSDGKLGLGLGEPNSSIFRQELWKFDCHSLDVKGDSGLGVGHRQDRFTLLISTLEASQYKESRDRTQTNLFERAHLKCLENSANHTEILTKSVYTLFSLKCHMGSPLKRACIQKSDEDVLNFIDNKIYIVNCVIE